MRLASAILAILLMLNGCGSAPPYTAIGSELRQLEERRIASLQLKNGTFTTFNERGGIAIPASGIVVGTTRDGRLYEVSIDSVADARIAPGESGVPMTFALVGVLALAALAATAMGGF